MSVLPPVPVDDRSAVEAWVAQHLGDVVLEGPGRVQGSPAFRGGQRAADGALAQVDLRGYAARRNEVLPVERRGASRLSPYIRHGLLPLPRVWDEAAGLPAKDRGKFRDELLWQEYARHVYARVGHGLGTALRYEPSRAPQPWDEPWDRTMACMELVVDELRGDGWIVNQTRMWMASQWTVRGGREWREGEDRFFRHLLDGSRAANRLGWQWTIGAGTGRPYGFSRWQVEKRAPGLCGRCALRDRCPVESFPDADRGASRTAPDALRADPDPGRTGGPEEAESDAEPEVVWLTAESLGHDDPALRARPDLPVVFVLDRDRLASWRLSGKRLVFLAETLGELGEQRDLEIRFGDPAEELHGRRLAATWTPVPGWRRLRDRLDVVERHPWPWLARPHHRGARSFSAWRKALPADLQRGR